MADVTVSIEVYCSDCGDILDAFGSKVSGSLDVRPCSTCLNANMDEANSQGYDDGYDAGYADAESGAEGEKDNG